jgi:multidrug resistance protein, MATE family
LHKKTKMNRYTLEIKDTLKLAIPIVFTQLAVILMGITDNLVVGRLLGSVALDISGIANSIAFTIASFGVGGLTVISPMISKANSEENPKQINRLFRASLKVVLAFIAINFLLGGFAYFRFDLFDQPSEIAAQSPRFLLILLFSNIPLFFFVAARQFTDGLADTKVVMFITGTAILVNLALNFVFIQGFGPIPAIGITGSAYATLSARIFMLVALLLYIYFQKNYKKYFINQYNDLSVNDLVMPLTKTSFMTGCQFFFEVAAFSMANIMMGWLGKDRLAAHLIVLNVASTTYMMATGISIAGSIRVGSERGLKNKEGISIAANTAMFITIIFMATMAILMLVFDKAILAAYISDPEVIKIGMGLIIIGAMFQLSDGIQSTSISLLRGMGDVQVPTMLTFVAYWLVALPLGYYLAIIKGMDAAGIWIALSVGLAASAVLLTFRFYQILRKVDFK